MLKLSIITIVGALIAAQASATFIIKRADTTSPPTLSSNIVEGFGMSIPMDDALSTIMPSDWTISTTKEILSLPASWVGGNHWFTVLSDITRKLELVATKDDITKVVSIYHKPPTKEYKETIEYSNNKIIVIDEIKDVDIAGEVEQPELITTNPLQKSDNVTPPDSLMTPQVQTKVITNTMDQKSNPITKSMVPNLTHPSNPKTSIIERQLPSFLKTTEYRASTGDSLKDTISAWATTNNISVLWRASADFTIKSQLVINNNFLSSVDQMLAFYIYSTNPLQYRYFTKNNILLVEDVRIIYRSN